MKTLVIAKSRLAELAGPHRAAFAVAVAGDTVAAALACPSVARVVVVTGDEIAAETLGRIGALVVDDPQAGLNAALRHGAAHAVRLDARCPVAALQADLPALRASELERVLSAAGEAEESFLPDAAEIGTTFYGVRRGVPFRPRFGGSSRERHLAGGAKELVLDGVASVRRDVDTPADLADAVALGLGPRTRGVVARMRPVAGVTLIDVQATVRSFDPATRSGSVFLDDGTEIPFDAPAFDAGPLRLLRSGQRVNIAMEGDKIVYVTLSTFPLPD
ncbi:2-phospho-L-lactate guanylyltransferase [Sinosporangium siamense]|uniref:2-phospho-L-lactate guanylyltransferase n=1 Tax=Sinosporangium siamense TaxID=1367973 RepID=UPI0027DCD42F|nr:2-phospho-L-lactate guanylyltransferase [Sinosporangium siamense]